MKRVRSLGLPVPFAHNGTVFIDKSSFCRLAAGKSHEVVFLGISYLCAESHFNNINPAVQEEQHRTVMQMFQIMERWLCAVNGVFLLKID